MNLRWNFLSNLFTTTLLSYQRLASFRTPFCGDVNPRQRCRLWGFKRLLWDKGIFSWGIRLKGWQLSPLDGIQVVFNLLLWTPSPWPSAHSHKSSAPMQFSDFFLIVFCIFFISHINTSYFTTYNWMFSVIAGFPRPHTHTLPHTHAHTHRQSSPGLTWVGGNWNSGRRGSDTAPC